jgi:hypothetical protein
MHEEAKMKKQTGQNDDDDGRVICSMDVDGMLWQNGRARQVSPRMAPVTPGARISDAESRKYSWYSLLAGLVIVAVFSVTWILFTLFCTLIWFR